MSLSRQLLLLSLLLLALPWAGYQVFSQLVGLLLQGELDAQRARAQLIVAYLQSQPEQFRDLIQLDSSQRIYFPSAPQPPLVDGDLADWPLQPAAPQGVPELYRLRVGDTLFLGTRLPARAPGEVQMALWTGAARIELELQLDGLLQPEPAYRALGVLGRWQVRGEQLVLELAFPTSQIGPQVGLTLAALGTANRSWGLGSQGKPLAWITQPEGLQDDLSVFADGGTRLAFLTTDGWEVAAAGSVPEFVSPSRWSTSAARWLPRQFDASLDQGSGEVVWIWDGTAPQLELRLPVRISGLAVGRLVLQSELHSFLQLYADLLRQWLLASLGLLVLVLAGLFAYAGWLSRRLRQLSRWTHGLIDEHGRVDGDFAPSRSADELGELTRAYAQLTRRLQKYTDYMEGMAGRLSHEMRTPLTIIGSSLDNLDSADDPEERAVFAERARQGIERLRKMLRSMAEANSLESGIERTARCNFDADALIRELVAAYGQAFPQARVTYRALDEARGGRLDGSPDLLAQLVDKLVENALSFAEPGTEIRVQSGRLGDIWRMSITNRGPLLPEGAEQDIFASMVSLRPAEKAADGHLGLGLSIARRIAEFHGGKLTAVNLADGSGVLFALEVPLATR